MTSFNRFETIEFVAKATKLARERKVGGQYDADVLQGPQIDEVSQVRILAYIESGKLEGAKLETGGNRWGTEGFFVEPTVFSNVTDNMKIARDEVCCRISISIGELIATAHFLSQIFGPVQSIFKFNTLEEVIERANDTSFGLAAGIVTKDIDAALTFARAVEAGSVWVNCYDAVVPQAPFGGYKQSGHGREL